MLGGLANAAGYELRDRIALLTQRIVNGGAEFLVNPATVFLNGLALFEQGSLAFVLVAGHEEASRCDDAKDQVSGGWEHRHRH